VDRDTARELLARLNRDAERLATRFQLRLQSIEAESPQVKRRYGICYSDGRIKIRLRHVTTGQPLRYSSLVNTLCHELAHLRHMNHGPRFKAFYLKILEHARIEGIYRPREAELPVVAAKENEVRAPSLRTRAAGPRPAPVAAAARPVQLTLF
jgi:predicted metal-dependent hydrolase